METRDLGNFNMPYGQDFLYTCQGWDIKKNRIGLYDAAALTLLCYGTISDVMI